MERLGGCLSYLTQQKGELSPETVAAMKQYHTVWGCDLCQTVCPMNEGVKETPIPFFKEQLLRAVTAEMIETMPQALFEERAFAWKKKKTILRNLKAIEETEEGKKHRMKLLGLQKMTMLDFPGRIACTVFTGGCNFRCPFCHNASLVLPDRMANAEQVSEESFFNFLKTRKGLLDGVAITGGEPLLHQDIDIFLRKIRDLGFAIKLDTNGCFPERLKALVAEDLVDYVAMDIKNSPARYAETVGLQEIDLAPIRESVDFLLQGSVPYEFRTTVLREFHTDEDFLQIGRWIEGADRYFLQNFVDSGELIAGQNGLSGYSKDDLERFVSLLRPFVKSIELRGV